MALVDNRTPNLGLPLPYRENLQSDDCERIAQSFTALDEAYGDVRMKAAAALEKADGALGADATAQKALGIAESALTSAGAALDEARGASSEAQSANTRSAEAKADAAGARATASAAVPKTGARGSLAGYETIGAADSLGEPPTVTIESPDCVNLETAGALTIAFTAADPSMRAVKALSLTAAEATTLTIEGAVWQNNGDAPEWGTAGAILVLLAHFVGGRVVLSVADNTEG